MIRIVFLFLFSLLVLPAFASENASQTLSLLYGVAGAQDDGFSVIQTQDGGYLASGYTYGSIGAGALIVKFKSDFHVQWSLRAPDLEGNPQTSIEQIKDGYVLNTFHSILKLDNFGHVKWYKKFIGNSLLSNITRTKDSNIVFATTGRRAIIWNFSSDGRVVWKKFYQSKGCYLGQTKSVLSIVNDRFVVSGDQNCNQNGNGVFLLQLNRSGRVEWEKLFNRDGWQEELTGLIGTKDGGYLMAARATTLPDPTKGSMLVFRKLDSTGNIQWEKTYKRPLLIKNLTELPDGSFIMAAGWHGPVGAIVKLDEQGNFVFLRWYSLNGHSVFLYGMDLTKDGGFILIGTAKSMITRSYDLLLVKLDSNAEIANPSCVIRHDNLLTPRESTAVSIDDILKTFSRTPAAVSYDSSLETFDFTGTSSICN